MLRRLGHTDGDNVIQLKGRTACEVNTADELVVAELVFAGAFSSLEPAQVGRAFLLSRAARAERCFLTESAYILLNAAFLRRARIFS